MVAQDLSGSFHHEDLRGIVVFCAGVGQSRHLPGNLRTKMPSTQYHKNILHPARKAVHRRTPCTFWRYRQRFQGL